MLATSIWVAAFLYAAESTTATIITGQQINDYLTSICFPSNGTFPGPGEPDTNAPCNAAQEIFTQCELGHSFVRQMASQDEGPYYTAWEDGNSLPQRDIQICLCESRYVEQLEGCYACLVEHADESATSTLGASFYTSASSSYCAVTNTPSTIPTPLRIAYGAESLLTGSVYTDVIGSTTAESVYWMETGSGQAATQVQPVTATGSALSFYASSGIIMRPGRSTASLETSIVTASSSSLATTSTTIVSTTLLSSSLFVATTVTTSAASTGTHTFHVRVPEAAIYASSLMAVLSGLIAGFL